MIIGDPKAAGPAADDTVEFELTAEQQLTLQAAGALARPAGERSERTTASEYDTYVCRRTDRVDRICTVAFATLVLGITAAAGWHAIGAAPPASVVAVQAPTAAPARLAAVQGQAPVVQVINPFDKTEVFELPASFTETEARDTIAEVLLQRARERFRQGFDVHRVTNRGAHATADSPLDVFVTRLSSAEDGSGGIAGMNTERAAAD